MRPGCIVFFIGGVGQSVHVNDKNTLVLQSCTDAPRVEHGLCSETSVRSSDDSIEVISINIEGEEMHLKEEVEPIAISFSAIKDKPEVSPQTFHQYLRLPSVIMLFVCVPFHINQVPVVNGNGLYIFTECVKYKG
jgi:hypothetical protein